MSGLSAVLALGNAIYLLYTVSTYGTIVFWAGNWIPPFGITMVVDMLSAILVLTTTIVSATIIFYSFRLIDEHRERHFYYFLIQMLLVGVNGSFVTGDIFNLYVFFEIFLISSYVLMVLGSTKGQLRETYKYVVLNILASIFFLVGVALLYGLTGTLNMADLANKLPLIENQGIVSLAAVIFIIVFGAKAAVFPLFFWLPQSYVQPPAAVSALFGGLLTKVGIYCMIRTFTLMFTGDTDFINGLLFVLGVCTMFLGGLGAIAQYNFKRILSYHIVSQVGYMIMGLAIDSIIALMAAIYFAVHNIIVKSSLFLFAGVTEEITGTNDLNRMGGLLHRYPLLGWGFFLGGISLAGVPPFSGFFAKLLMLSGSSDADNYWAMFFTLSVGFLTLFSMIKIFLYCFWGEEKPVRHEALDPSFNYRRYMLPCLFLVLVSIMMGLGAEQVIGLIQRAAEELRNPELYIKAVLGTI
jgi:multicomponent Na+:H+ antiporter subunit D